MRIGPYEVVSLLGKGGMGAVYEVSHPQQREHLALKIMEGESYTPEQTARFRREARILELLGQHAGIARLRDVGDDRGRPYLVMDLYKGGTLEARVTEQRSTRDEVLADLVKIARAVHFAHEAGVVHRDLKPVNILYDDAGAPRVADFGVAREGTSGLTKTGAFVGTLDYMAPEQVESSKTVDRRADVYALGAILYWILKGEPPFKGATGPNAFKRILLETPAAPGAGPALDAVCLKALAKEPSARHETAEELAQDIEAALGTRRAGPRGGSSKGAIVAVALVAFGAGAGGAWAVGRTARATPPSPAVPPEPVTSKTIPPGERLRAVRDPASFEKAVWVEVNAARAAPATSEGLARFEAVAAACLERGRRDLAASVLMSLVHEVEPERRLAFVEAAYATDLAGAATDRTAAREGANLLARAVSTELGPGTADTVVIARSRERLLAARLLAPDLNLLNPFEQLVAIARRGTLLVRSTAQPWRGTGHAPMANFDEADFKSQLAKVPVSLRGPDSLPESWRTPLDAAYRGDIALHRTFLADLIVARPDMPAAWLGFGRVTLQLGRFAESLRALQHGQELATKDPELPLYEAKVYEARGETDQAIAAFRRSMQNEESIQKDVKKRGPWSRIGIAHLLNEVGKVDEARELAWSVVVNREAYQSRGYCELLMRLFPRGSREHDEATRLLKDAR